METLRVRGGVGSLSEEHWKRGGENGFGPLG